MTDPDAADRLTALRSTRTSSKVPHAQAAKILTAGLSTSMVLGIVAYLGRSANIAAAASAHDAQRLATSQILVEKLFRASSTVPVTLPPTTVPVVGTPSGGAAPRVVAVPVPVPAKPAATPKSTPKPAPKPATTTRSSK